MSTSLRLASLIALLVPALAHADSSAPHPVEGVAMDGPYASLEALCAAMGDDAERCLHPPESCGAAATRKSRVQAPFVDAAIVELRGSPGSCTVALKTDRGWWHAGLSAADQPPWMAFLTGTDRYASELQPVAPVDGAPGLVAVRGTFVHWTSPEKMRWLKRPKRDEWYECEERVSVCGVGPSGTPSCTLPLPVAFTTYCRDGDDATKPLTGMPRTAADFRFRLTITRDVMTFAGAPQRRQTPLPGWYVIALNAERMKDWKRTLPSGKEPFLLK